MENAYDRRERTVYVSGMHRSVTEDHLYDLFQKAGPIEKVILKENQDGTPQHALVVFKNVNSVMFSIAYLQGTKISDYPINIRPLRESSHHSALESAMAQQQRLSSVGAGNTQQQPVQSPNTQQQQMPYYLRSHARAAQLQQGHTGATCNQQTTGQTHFSGPIGASLFGSPLYSSSVLGGSSAASQRGQQPLQWPLSPSAQVYARYSH